MTELVDYIEKTFDVEPETFLEIFKTNPNARQSINGILGEMLFKDYAETLGYDLLRIKEKPSGGYNAKSAEARGDFYIRKKGDKRDDWLVVECKSVKSNSEKRAGLTDKKKCLNFLVRHTIERESQVKRIYASGERTYNSARGKWASKKKTIFPPFTWNKKNPGSGIPDISHLWQSKREIVDWINSFSDESFGEDAYWDLKAPVRLLQTHMPSTRTCLSGIKSTGPLVTEFNILCVDLFLKTGKHEFVFANSEELNHQSKAPNHLQQNYTIDILTAKDDFKRHKLIEPWYDNLDDCIKYTNPTTRRLDYSQLDLR